MTTTTNDRFQRTFGPIRMEYLDDGHIGQYVAVHCTVRNARISGYLRSLDDRVDAPAEEASQPGVTSARPSVRHGVMELSPGSYCSIWADVHEQVTVFECATCVGQMFHRYGGPAHDPQPTCRQRGGGPAHCTCRGCW